MVPGCFLAPERLFPDAMSSHENEKHDSVDEKHQQVGVDEIHAHTDGVFSDSALDPVYQAKARILNDAIQEIGMGKYQW